MSEYQKLLDQISHLQTKAAEIRKAEVKTVIAEIRVKMEEYGITPNQLGARRGQAVTGSKVAAKYRSPDGSDTWSGRGRKPRWLVEALERGATLQSLEI